MVKFLLVFISLFSFCAFADGENTTNGGVDTPWVTTTKKAKPVEKKNIPEGQCEDLKISERFVNFSSNVSGQTANRSLRITNLSTYHEIKFNRIRKKFLGAFSFLGGALPGKPVKEIKLGPINTCGSKLKPSKSKKASLCLMILTFAGEANGTTPTVYNDELELGYSVGKVECPPIKIKVAGIAIAK